MKDVPGICHPNRSDQAITGIGLCMEPRMPLPWEWNRSRCDGVPGKKNIEAANANGCVNLISGVKDSQTPYLVLKHSNRTAAIIRYSNEVVREL